MNMRMMQQKGRKCTEKTGHLKTVQGGKNYDLTTVQNKSGMLGTKISN